MRLPRWLPRPVYLMFLAAALTFAATAHAQSVTTPTLADYGIVGVVLAGAGGLLVLAWREFRAETERQREAHQKTIESTTARHAASIEALFDAHRDDSAETRTVLRENAKALADLRVELGKR